MFVARLEDLRKGVRVLGVTPTGPVTVIDADWLGADTLTLTYEDSGGATEREILYRSNEDDLELVDAGRLLFIEVKGRVAGADRFTVTKRELSYGLNNADRHVLALVRVDEDDTTTVRYLYDPFGGREHEPSAAEYDRRLSWDAHWGRSAAPS